jgi:hypothetical protein
MLLFVFGETSGIGFEVQGPAFIHLRDDRECTPTLTRNESKVNALQATPSRHRVDGLCVLIHNALREVLV